MKLELSEDLFKRLAALAAKGPETPAKWIAARVCEAEQAAAKCHRCGRTPCHWQDYRNRWECDQCAYSGGGGKTGHSG